MDDYLETLWLSSFEAESFDPGALGRGSSMIASRIGDGLMTATIAPSEPQEALTADRLRNMMLQLHPPVPSIKLVELREWPVEEVGSYVELRQPRLLFAALRRLTKRVRRWRSTGPIMRESDSYLWNWNNQRILLCSPRQYRHMRERYLTPEMVHGISLPGVGHPIIN